jgi:hypothetical protein
LIAKKNHPKAKPMKTMTTMITPLAFSHQRIKKIENVPEKKAAKKEKIRIKIRIKIVHIKNHLKEICVNIF